MALAMSLRTKVSPQLAEETRFAAHGRCAITREPMANPEPLFTSLMDPARYKVEEVSRCTNAGDWSWPMRDEDGHAGQAMTLRSQQPDGAKQELWATFVDVQPIRLEITHAEAKVQPCRISFITALPSDEWLGVQDHTPLRPSWPSLRP